MNAILNDTAAWRCTRPASDPIGQVSDALRYLSPDCDRDTWVHIGMAVKDRLGEPGFAVWDAWSQGADSYREKDARDAWKSFRPGKVTAGTLFHLAQQAGWRAQGGARLSPPPLPDPAQTAEARRALEQRQTATARKAWSIFRYAPPAFEHPYLTRKGVSGYGARLFHDKLALPLYARPHATPENLVNLQLINADGEKRFLKDGRKAGCFWWVGDYPQSDAATICLAEGFATAASLHQATGHRCYLAFDAGNMPAVAEAIRQEHPQADIVVCADNDLAGLKYGGRAAGAIGARLAYPEIDGQDFNDVWQQGGGYG